MRNLIIAALFAAAAFSADAQTLHRLTNGSVRVRATVADPGIPAQTFPFLAPSLSTMAA